MPDIDSGLHRKIVFRLACSPQAGTGKLIDISDLRCNTQPSNSGNLPGLEQVENFPSVSMIPAGVTGVERGLHD
jgi:hypothetical protein